jgi:outer membrane receptor for ferrienterochelin and colicin
VALNALAQTSETVVVVGAIAECRAFDAPCAVGIVDAGALRSAGPMVNLSEALARVPGLTVNMRNNCARDLQIRTRGLFGRGDRQRDESTVLRAGARPYIALERVLAAQVLNHPP